ncbi:MAG: iron ABC transporter permease [Spirochaetes bacterium]|jgi:iron complex transport system permease protein|nr:iron ABC transporter permease [Spirochaetota bacterium]
MKQAVRTTLFVASGFIVAVAFLSLGSELITPGNIFSSLTGSGSEIDRSIVLGIRLPRLIMAAVLGASLAVSGAVFQSLLRNPLADPYIIGVSSGAALGATVAIVLSLAYPLVVLSSFIGSGAAITAVHLVSRRLRMGSATLILAGISVSFIFSSSVFLIYSLTSSEKVHKSLMWMMGDLSMSRPDLLAAVSGASVILMSVAWIFHRQLNILSFGRSFARSHGVPGSSLNTLFWTASLLAAVSVTAGGIIGFVGLIVPHAARALFGPDHVKLLPASAFGGAAFLVMADAIGRSIAPPYEIPVGVITSFFGGIFFIVYMMKRRAPD